MPPAPQTKHNTKQRSALRRGVEVHFLHPVEMPEYFVLNFGLHMHILGGKRHVFSFPLHVLHGFVRPGKVPRHFDWMQECPS